MDEEIKKKIKYHVLRAYNKSKKEHKRFSKRYHAGGITLEIKDYCIANNIEYTDDLHNEIATMVSNEISKFDQSGEEKIHYKKVVEEAKKQEEERIAEEEAEKRKKEEEKRKKQEERQEMLENYDYESEEPEEESEKPLSLADLDKVKKYFDDIKNTKKEIEKIIEDYYFGFPTDMTEQLENFFFNLKTFEVYFFEHKTPNQDAYENLMESFEKIKNLLLDEEHQRLKQQCKKLISSFEIFKILFDQILNEIL